MSSKLPSDLEEEILSWVPTKSLSRLRFVCKQWNSLFHDPRFIEKHLSNHASSQEFILCDPRVYNPKFINVEIHHNSDNTALSSLKIHELTPRNIPLYHRKVFRVIHADGLLLSVTNLGLEISNPFLKQERVIHVADLYSPKGKKFAHAHLCSTYCLGHGDKLSDGYKVLRLYSLSCRSDSTAEIFDLRLGAWRILDVTFDWFLAMTGIAVSLKGNSYMIAMRKGTQEGFVQRFDFSTERFEPFSDLPFKYEPPCFLGMSVMGGDRLSMLERHLTQKADVWVTNKIGDGIEISWSKLMTVDNFTCHLTAPTYFLDESKKLFLCSEGGALMSVYILEVDGTLGQKLDICALWHISCNYVPSLVPIP